MDCELVSKYLIHVQYNAKGVLRKNFYSHTSSDDGWLDQAEFFLAGLSCCLYIYST